MNAQITPGTTPQVVDMLESTQADIDQFSEEICSEQVSVEDRYAQLKKELQTAIRQMKEMLRENKVLSREITNTLRERLATLEEQAAARATRLTKAELEAQLNLIRRGMEDLVGYLRTLRSVDFSMVSMLDKAYRLKIKLAILGLKFQLGALAMKETVLDMRHDLKKTVRRLREKAVNSEVHVTKRWNVFRHEIGEAYEHLQKAFTSK